MDFKQDILLTVDAVLFGYNREEGLSVLLIKRRLEPFIHHWALPGGFVRDKESLEDAVLRELKEEAGVEVNYLEQLFTFGTPDRDPRQRVVSVTYYGLVRPEGFQIKASSDAEDAAWFNLNKLPTLAFDHGHIIQTALERLRGKVTYEPVGFELLEPKFPFSDLEKLYMAILNRDLDRRNFKRKIMKLGVVVELDELASSEGAGRPGHLYKFDKEKFLNLKKEGFVFDIVI
ncbi:NUDIX domain-containing protein [Cytophagaceae bacterium ABcell3]|nr:NUDIX domain-containing protein [Cytophagaceae bacterium ABcell3]